jgi:hypothetical protein
LGALGDVIHLTSKIEKKGKLLLKTFSGFDDTSGQVVRSSQEWIKNFERLLRKRGRKREHKNKERTQKV